MKALCRFCDPNIFRGYGFERSNRTFLLRTQKNETVSQENLLFRGNPSEGLPRPPYSYHCKDAIFVLMLGGMELKNIKVFSKLYY